MATQPSNRMTALLVMLTVVYCAFVLAFEKSTAIQAEMRIEEHALVIANNLWNYNYKGSKEYLNLAAEADHYAKLTITSHNGEVFQEISTAIPAGFEKFLIGLHLVPQVVLVAPVEYNGNVIGWIDALWIPQTLFTHIGVLCFMVMVVLVILLYRRVAGQKNLLEERVAERTRELLQANLILKREILERSLAEKSSLESERKYRFLTENMEEVIWTMDQDKVCVYMSPVAVKMYGWNPSELEGTRLESIFLPSSLSAYQQILDQGWQGVSNSDDYSEPKVLEVEMQYRDGGLIWCEITVSFVATEADLPQRIMCVSRNVTERKQSLAERQRLQERLERSKKMESLGLLAGGVAHDLNNVLSGIVSYPELILLDLAEDSPVRERVTAVRDSGIKAAEIVRDLLTLARRGVVAAKVININTLVREYHRSPEFSKMMSYHPGIEVYLQLEESLANIYGSAVQIKKVIMNLVSNAAEAQPHGGKIFISTKSRYLEYQLQRYQTIPAGEYVTLQVEDKGEGITNAEMKQIFEPFYTKKVMGRSGTGLGLTVVWGTLEDHKGFIDISSSKNMGTVIDLYFPLTRDIEEIEASLSANQDIRGNGETVLVVDDIEHQRQIAAAILNRLNYRVATAASGEEAVAYLRANSADIILLDMIMESGMDGLETYRQILSIHPQQRAIIASGYSATDQVMETLRLGAGGYLQKPYLIEKIGKIIKLELGRGLDSG